MQRSPRVIFLQLLSVALRSVLFAFRQIVATDFRAGNVSPNTDNLGFIKTCQDALSKGTNIKKLRIDAAG
jgi:hypothetical protein